MYIYVNSIILRGLAVLRQEGTYSFIKKSLRWLFLQGVFKTVRPILPEVEFQEKNDVYMPTQIRVGDQYLDYVCHDPENEDGLVSAHQEFTRQGDTVIIVGGEMGLPLSEQRILLGGRVM